MLTRYTLREGEDGKFLTNLVTRHFSSENPVVSLTSFDEIYNMRREIVTYRKQQQANHSGNLHFYNTDIRIVKVIITWETLNIDG